MKISEIKPEILQTYCKISNKKEKYIIIDYIKNMHDKNNIKIFNPLNNEIRWVPFNNIELLNN